MTALRLEAGERAESGPCECCGNMTQTIWGYIFEDRAPAAVYYARWTKGKPDDDAIIAISIGEWGSHSRPQDRNCVAMRCKLVSGQPQFMIIDAATTPWQSAEVLGVMLSRDQVLSSDISQRAYSMIDCVVEEDLRFSEFAKSN